VVSLMLSDVVGDRLEVIASGPTVGDPSTWAEVGAICERYRLWQSLPKEVRRRLEQGMAGELAETPKPGEPEVASVLNLVVASNRQALAAAARRAEELGYRASILGATIEGETREVARAHAALAHEVLECGHPLAPPCCLLSGGETTVALEPGHGMGGRNQEFALAAALELQALERVLVLSAGSDGTDGPTESAGAQADGQTVTRARALGQAAEEHLVRHDAYPFFRALGDLVITGPTRTNVMDIRLLLVGPPEADVE
jgi:hydroxypyruvate reductase